MLNMDNKEIYSHTTTLVFLLDFGNFMIIFVTNIVKSRCINSIKTVNHCYHKNLKLTLLNNVQAIILEVKFFNIVGIKPRNKGGLARMLIDLRMMGQ